MKIQAEIKHFIEEKAKEFEVPVNEIHLRVDPPGFLSVWQYFEKGEECKRWLHLETKKIT